MAQEAEKGGVYFQIKFFFLNGEERPVYSHLFRTS